MFSKSHLYFLALLISSGSVLAFSQAQAQTDEPDLNKEKRFHQIYQNYNSSPTPEDVWVGAASGKTQSYGVQEGDTLWDVSETLFGDSKFWPKVWSLNAEKIENPHEIFPGQAVQFTPGTTGEAPSMTLGLKAEPEPVEEEAPAAPENKELLSRAELPPAPKKSPVAKVPRSLPGWTYGRKTGVDLKFEVEPRNRAFAAPIENLSYFISDQPITGVGTISETEMSGKVASDYQYIYVKLPSGVSEKKLVAVKEIDSLEDSQSGTKGHLIQVQGEIEILEPVNASENLYRAMVLKSINPVEVGSQLIIGELPTFSVNEEGEGSGSAKIIGGQFEAQRRLMEFRSLVFLSGQGLTVGQVYPVYKKQTIRNGNSQVIENPRQIGKVKVVRGGGPFATAVVLQSSEEIRPGDVTNPQMRSE